MRFRMNPTGAVFSGIKTRSVPPRSGPLARNGTHEKVEVVADDGVHCPTCRRHHQTVYSERSSCSIQLTRPRHTQDSGLPRASFLQTE